MSTAASVARRGETELLRTQVNVSAAATGRKSKVEALVLARALAADDELLAVISSEVDAAFLRGALSRNVHCAEPDAAVQMLRAQVDRLRQLAQRRPVTTVEDQALLGAVVQLVNAQPQAHSQAVGA